LQYSNIIKKYISASARTQFNPQKNSLNFIRLLLALLVIVSHAYVIGEYGQEPIFLGNTLGGWGVIGFFCISGYLITASRDKQKMGGGGKFLIQRIARIFPAFIVCHIVIVVFFAPAAHIINTDGIIDYFSTAPTPLDYLTNNLSVSLKISQYDIGNTLMSLPLNSWCGPLYTLYYEFFSYLLIGALMTLPLFRKPLPIFIIWILSVIAQLETDLIMQYTTAEAMLHYLRLVPFFLGGSLFYFIRTKAPLHWTIAAVSIAIITLTLIFTPISGWAGTAILAPLITYTLLWVGTILPIGKVGQLTRKNDVSYGVYIYGWPVQQLLMLLFYRNIFPKPAVGIYIIVTMLISIGFAIASWFVIEKPVLDFIRRRRQSYQKPCV
jgi:peptidoglycan/LPS O-acetylase OafA/YrhL